MAFFVFIMMSIPTRLLRVISASKLEQLCYSPIGALLAKCFNIMYANKGEKPYRIHDIMINIDFGKTGERTIPFNAYEPMVTKKVLELLKPNDIVIDVGSWIGYYALLCAKKASKVIAIELSSDNVRRIRENVALNQFQNIEVLHCAIGEKHSLGKVKPGVASSTNQLVENKGHETEAVAVESLEEAVAVESLDNIVLQRKYHKVDLVIMDIEGYEYFALLGMKQILSEHLVRNMIIEVHPYFLTRHHVSENDIAHLLHLHGYSVKEISRLNTGQYHLHAYV
jgi:FkbM family methyltransferase